ncbi:hypothetical protein BT93_D1906 [Corymbia citriodora subsp. variegata]|nr:hypothetical protein BT93_D1906 [Corymbia citriodora subsp. variegata]
MASKSVSLMIIFCILLGSHCLLSRLSAARILTDDDHNKIGAVGKKPKPDGSWSGSSTPSGNNPRSPPTYLHPGAIRPHASLPASCGRAMARYNRYSCTAVSHSPYNRTTP